jgi:hypothetical protein
MATPENELNFSSASLRKVFFAGLNTCEKERKGPFLGGIKRERCGEISE